MELAYFSGYARLKQRQTGGAGVVLRFERVRPRQRRRFQPLSGDEITPQFLDRDDPGAEALEISTSSRWTRCAGARSRCRTPVGLSA